MEIKNGGIYSNLSAVYPEKTTPSLENRPGLQTQEKAELPAEKRYSKQELEKEIDVLNKWMQSRETHLKFTLHEELNEYYVQIINDQTNEVIREIPSKKVMDMVAQMNEIVGFLIDEKR